MNPCIHNDTILASNAQAEANTTDTTRNQSRFSSISRESLPKGYVDPNVLTDATADQDESTTESPRNTTMTHTIETLIADAIINHNTYSDEEVNEYEILNQQDETADIALEATSSVITDSEFALVGRRIADIDLITFDAQIAAGKMFDEEIEADNAARSSKRIKRAEKLADETGEVRITDEVIELGSLSFAPLNQLASHDAPEDVLEALELEENLGFTLLEANTSKMFLALTFDDSSCPTLAINNANGWKILDFVKAINDFSGYDLEAQPDMKAVSENIHSTGRLLDSQGFEAIVWEDAHVSAFIRHCVNVAQKLKQDLFFDKRAQKQCNRLSVKRQPGVSNRVVVAASLPVDKAREEIQESQVRLTGVYNYEGPVAKAVESPVVKTEVSVAPVATQKQQPQQPKKVKEAPQPNAQVTQVAQAPVASDLDSNGMVRRVKVAKANKPTRPQVQKAPEPTHPRLNVGDELTVKVVRFADYGAIVKDIFGNEGFLPFREKNVSGKGGVDHGRLLVNLDDEVSVKVLSVASNGFAKVTLRFIADAVNHYLSCLPVGEVQLGLVQRRRSEHAFYITLGGAIDGILAVRDIPNLQEVKHKLRPETRVSVRITSVNTTKRNFHVSIESFVQSSVEKDVDAKVAA